MDATQRKIWKCTAARRVLDAFNISEEAGLAVYKDLLNTYETKSGNAKSKQAAQQAIFGVRSQSIRSIACKLDDEHHITQYYNSPIVDRPYYKCTLMKVDDLYHLEHLLETEHKREKNIRHGKIQINSPTLLMNKFENLAIRSIEASSELLEKSVWSATICLSFSLCLRQNEITGIGRPYEVNASDFQFNGWTCTITCGSRVVGGAPRPPYTKLCLLPPHITRALVDFVYRNKNVIVARKHYLTAHQFRNFKNIVTESGITSCIEELSSHLTPCIMRSIGAAVLSLRHDCSSCLSNKHTSVTRLTQIQLGHDTKSVSTTERYLAIKVIEDEGEEEPLRKKCKLGISDENSLIVEGILY